MIRVVVADLARCPADAVVRPTSSHFDALVTDSFGLGGAVVTAGQGVVAAEFVIQACIREEPHHAPTRDMVGRAWRAALQQASEWEFRHVAAPILGADDGTGALPAKDVVDLLVEVLEQHRARSAFPVEVSFVVANADERDVIEAALRRASARAS
ncbi:MAG TPA: macro domain-containing protein [Gemmatimonadales bacterium]|nr:macro domain-containing protein [Gemmatimonadales bacterium]